MTKTLSILVVDDEPDLREVMQFQLDRMGFRTLTAPGGDEALALLEKTQVDLVISDVRMPDGDGVELLRNVRSRWLTTPFILMTGYSDITRAEAFELGAEALYSKPYRLSEVVDFARVLLLPLESRWSAPRTQKPAHEFKFSASEQEFFWGRGGLSVRFRGRPPHVTSGAEIGFTIETPDSVLGPRFEAIGKVNWSDENSWGIELLWIEKASHERFVAWTQKARPIAHIPRPTNLIKS